MMSMLVAAIRGKNRRTVRDPGLGLRSNYPQYVLYDSDGDEVECNLSTMKMSYGSDSKTVLTDVIISQRKGFWSRRTSMERHLIMLIVALFVVTSGLVLAAGILSYNRDITLVFLSDDSRYSSSTSPSIGSHRTDETIDLKTKSSFTNNSVEEYESIGFIDYNIGQKVAEVVICNSSACEKAGQMIQASLNESVDPCDDFYGFACGGWEASHTIPKDRSVYGAFDEVDENLKKSIKEELSESRGEGDSKAVVFASDLYKACIDEETIDSRGVSPLVTVLNSMGGWPLTGVFNDSGYDWRESFAEQLLQLGFGSVYSISIQPDANDTLVNRVYFDSSNFGLGRNQLVNTSAYPEIVLAYKQYILQSALLLGANNDSKTLNDIEDMIAFESQLANLSLPLEKKRDSSVWYNRMSFEAFNQLTDNRVDWLNLTNRIYSKLNSTIVVKSDELVVVQDMDYYKAVSLLLTKTPNRVIANYLGWMTTMSLSSYTTKKFREVAFAFNHVVSGVEDIPELWKTCVERLSNSIEYAVSRLYVDKNFTPEDRQEASLMIQDIKESYNQLIVESEWLDEMTKNKSLVKLNAIKQNIGFPDWLMNDQELDHYYNLTQEVDPKKSFESIIYLQYNSVLRQFKSIREDVNLDKSWPMPPAIVNAAYEPTQNSITIPAGIMKIPFFDGKRPVYLNYGGIGLVVGHEMTHGFDDEGSQFDPKGDLINWWTEEVHKRFEEKAECFIKEYSAIYDKEADMQLNGKNTVGENIADNGGLRESFRAYEMYVKTHGEQPRLPIVSQFTPKQLFFLSNANVWCTLIRPEALKQKIQYNPHSPAKYRVNVPFSNFKGFSDAFKCGPNSRMNRKDKCILW